MTDYTGDMSCAAQACDAHHEVERAQADRVAGPRLSGLLALWQQAHRGGRALPPRSGFRHRQLFQWMGNLYLFQVQRTPLAMKATLVGTHWVGLTGLEFTGQRLDSAARAGRNGRLYEPFFRAVETATPLYAYSAHPALPGALHRLILPCAEDGNTIDCLLCAGYAHDRLERALMGRKLAPYLGHNPDLI